LRVTLDDLDAIMKVKCFEIRAGSADYEIQVWLIFGPIQRVAVDAYDVGLRRELRDDHGRERVLRQVVQGEVVRGGRPKTDGPIRRQLAFHTLKLPIEFAYVVAAYEPQIKFNPIQKRPQI
jgi:hypothetical protein